MLKMVMLIFWVVMPCGLLSMIPPFWRNICWYLPVNPHRVAVQKNNIYDNFANFFFVGIYCGILPLGKISYVWEQHAEENIWALER
jgi:hypothetical protein